MVYLTDYLINSQKELYLIQKNVQQKLMHTCRAIETQPPLNLRISFIYI